MTLDKICEECLINSCCTDICEKWYNWKNEDWIKFKETKACISCGHKIGYLYEPIGRDPYFEMQCVKCKLNFCLGFEEENEVICMKMSDEVYKGDQGYLDFYEGRDKEERSFKEILELLYNMGYK
jgi:hypothetical protein